MSKKKYLRQEREDAVERLARIASAASYALGCMGDAKGERGDFGEEAALNAISRELFDAVFELQDATTALEEARS